MIGNRQRQRGIVLVVSLLMIAVLALLATASINLGTGSALIVGNQQAEQATQAQADALVEETINNLDIFKNRVELAPEMRDGFEVFRSKPVCVAFTVVPGFSFRQNAPAPQYNYFRFTVGAEEASSGAQARVQTGVRVLQPPGTC